MSIGNAQGAIETGYIDFNGESQKTITLSVARAPGSINLIVSETNNVEAAAVSETDIPARNVGNIQVSASWLPGSPNQFYISTSAEFYGRVLWSIISG